MYKSNLNFLKNCLFLQEQPEQDSVQKNPSNILELDTQPPHNDHC